MRMCVWLTFAHVGVCTLLVTLYTQSHVAHPPARMEECSRPKDRLGVHTQPPDCSGGPDRMRSTLSARRRIGIRPRRFNLLAHLQGMWHGCMRVSGVRMHELNLACAGST